jgi:tetratricopeptide (TPR) repeat protein
MKSLVALILFVVAAPSLSAQDKFVTQVLIVPTFQSEDMGRAHKAADIVRDRVNGAFSRDELRVVSAGDIADWLHRSGLDEDMPLTAGELLAVAREFRADEQITGEVVRTPGGFRVTATLALIRDLRSTQPISAEGTTVESAAATVAQEMIAARRQLTPLRRCENYSRAGQFTQAIASASEGVSAYPRATFARICLMTSLGRVAEDRTDSVIAVARAVLAITPTNPLALEYLAESYESKGERDLSAEAWVRLLATDSTSEALVERAVTALSRLGKADMAHTIVDRASDAHPTNESLLKLRWLVHLAMSDWKGAIAAAERMMAADSKAQTDPDFFARLARAYRADSQPDRALVAAAVGVSRFPKDAPLYTVYTELLLSESEVAVARGLARFPESAPLHVLAAQQLRAAGQVRGALTETRRALADDPRLPHALLQIAEYQVELGEPDSAIVTLEQAAAHGESRATVAQFALAKGDGLYKAANGTKRREDFEQARRFLLLAKRLEPTPEAAFLLGASALSVGQAAANEAPAGKSCDLSKLAEASLAEAEENLNSGGSVAPDAARQFLEFLSQLRPFVADQLKAFCAGAPRN